MMHGWPTCASNHLKRFQFLSNTWYVISTLYNRILALIYTERLLLGQNLPGKAKNGNNGKFCNRRMQPDLFNTVKYTLTTIQHILLIRQYAVWHIPVCGCKMCSWCMCVCVCVCFRSVSVDVFVMHVCFRSDYHTHTHTNIDTHLCTHIQTHTHTEKTRALTHAHTHTQKHVHLQMCTTIRTHPHTDTWREHSIYTVYT
jgi:hypothetical protein